MDSIIKQINGVIKTLERTQGILRGLEYSQRDEQEKPQETKYMVHNKDGRLEFIGTKYQVYEYLNLNKKQFDKMFNEGCSVKGYTLDEFVEEEE